jgi:hypothetical protein
MLPDYMTSYNPLKERLTGKNEEADRGKVRIALQKILDGKGGGPEFGAVDGSAEAKALRMLGGNTGRFAGNYVLKNYDKLDPMVKEMVGSIDPKMGSYGSSDSFAGDFKAGSAEEKARMEAVKADPLQRPFSETPKSVRLAVERRARAEQPKASFLNPEMENVGLQEGGMVPVDGEGNVPPQAVAGDVVNGAPMGMVDVPNGGGPVDDGVPTELPEGTVVINAAAIRFHGTETIDNLINTAVDELLSEGVQISMQDPNPEDNVPVAISNGEYIIPPEVAEKIGYKKLEDMNERGRAYLQKQEAQEKQKAEAQQQPQQPSQPPPESFMGEPMPPEQEGPPPAPVQSEQQAMAMMGMMGGGRVPYAEGTAAVPAPKVGLIKTLQNFMSQFGDNVSDMFGGEVEPTAEALPKRLSGQGALTDTPTPTSLIPARPENKFAAPFKPVNMDPALSDETMPTYIPKFNTPQARAEGGFVGDYNYAQPQQTTIGTPFPNAVDSNPQQSQSFLQPNNAKKNSRVELANGNAVSSFIKKVAQKYVDSSPVMGRTEEELTTEYRGSNPTFVPLPSKNVTNQVLEFPRDFQQEDNIAFVERPKTNAYPSELSEAKIAVNQKEKFTKENIAIDRVLSNPVLSEELFGGDNNIAKEKMYGRKGHVSEGKPVFDGTHLLPYLDGKDNLTIGGINLASDNAISRKVNAALKANGGKLSVAQYADFHEEFLTEANAYVDILMRGATASEKANLRKARPVLVDMHFNAGGTKFPMFTGFIAAVKAGNVADMEKEIKYGGKPGDANRSYNTYFKLKGTNETHNRAVRNINRLKDIFTPSLANGGFIS